MKFKVFNTTYYLDLEHKMNDFVRHQDVEVLNIVLSVSSSHETKPSRAQTIYCVVMSYREKGKEAENNQRPL